jgi:hypothetical protein
VSDLIGEFFSITKKMHRGIKPQIAKSRRCNGSRDLLRAGLGEKGDAHKSHSHFIAACQRHHQRFCQPARRFVYPMRSKESAFADSVHAGRLVIKANKAALNSNARRCCGFE